MSHNQRAHAHEVLERNKKSHIVLPFNYVINNELLINKNPKIRAIQREESSPAVSVATRQDIEKNVV